MQCCTRARLRRHGVGYSVLWYCAVLCCAGDGEQCKQLGRAGREIPANKARRAVPSQRRFGSLPRVASSIVHRRVVRVVCRMHLPRGIFGAWWARCTNCTVLCGTLLSCTVLYCQTRMPCLQRCNRDGHPRSALEARRAVHPWLILSWPGGPTRPVPSVRTSATSAPGLGGRCAQRRRTFTAAQVNQLSDVVFAPSSEALVGGRWMANEQSADSRGNAGASGDRLFVLEN